jgi:phospholipid/cholesterol/gamma-HCH transport system ATP-binding protein
MIVIENLHKSFRGTQVLKGVNLTIEKGKTFVIIGRSGCGKSVLLKHIIGLIKPDKGRILIDGRDITKMRPKELKEIRKKFGMLFQASALFDSLTVGENVGFGLRRHTNLDKAEITKLVTQKLGLVGLRGIEFLKPAELSGGMKKRVGLARAIAMDPQLVLYDEPTTGLDPIMADIINELIIELHDKLKITSVAVTHDMTSAYKIADSIAMLYEGRIIEVGTPGKMKKTENPIVRQFITGAALGPITAG